MKIKLANNRTLHYESVKPELMDSSVDSVMWIHGFSCDGSDWRYQLEQLGEGFHHIAVDLNAHGQSPMQLEGLSVKGMAEDIVLLAAALGIENASLVGHSMGCRVILEALSHPDSNFKRAALIDCGITATPDTLQEKLDLNNEITNSGDLGPAVEEQFQGMFFGHTFDELKKQIIERTKKLPDVAAKALVDSIQTWDALSMVDKIAAVDVPLLVVESTNINEQWERVQLKKTDTSTFLEKCKTAPNNKQFQLEVIEDAGHFVMLERPEEVNRILEGFLS